MILGPMFSGKSTKLIEIYNSYVDNVSYDSTSITSSLCSSRLIINHSSDTRYGVSEIVTHDKIKVPCLSINDLSDLFAHVNIHDYTHIFIDEGQFFMDLLKIVKILIINYGKIVYIAGLDGDYRQVPFTDSGILELIPYATTITKLTAKCYKCGNIAQATKRIAANTQQILVGGANDYVPVCIKHINESEPDH